MRRAALATSLLILPLTAGCVLGPDYKRPPAPVHEAWREIPASTAESLANTPWWDLFKDPSLQELIRAALAENRNLKVAVERIEEARARYGFTRSDLWPTVDAGGAVGRFQPSEVGTAGPNPGNEVDFYQLSAAVSWEIDVFGRVRRASEAEMAMLMATEEARRFAVLTLVSDVARVYVELRDFDRRLEISRATLKSRREYLQIAKDRFEGGLTSELDYRQAEAELHRTQAIVYDFERVVTQRENALSVLLGRPPGDILRGRGLAETAPPPAVPAGLPSDLLDRRPDIRRAEKELHAATANIGAAKALLFPRIALTGSLGWESTEFSDLLTRPASVWTIAGNILQPIFNAGRNRRRVEITESQQRQTLYAYEQSILEAFREVEDTLIAYRKAGEQRISQAARVEAQRKVLALAEMRYRGGVAAYLEVLDAQRSLLNAELDEAQTIQDHLVALIRLYKALGGGWPAAPEAPASGAGPTAP